MRKIVFVLFSVCLLSATAAEALDDWTQVFPATHPNAQKRFGMAYVGGDRVLLFGGGDDPVYYDETWIFDRSETTWTQMFPATHPSARNFPAMAYLGDDRVVHFGGSIRDTWVYDYSDNTWTEMFPTTVPPGTNGAMSYIGDDKAVLMGPWDGNYLATWIYDDSETTWTQMSTGPEGRGGHDVVYIGDDQVIVAGSDRYDTWHYDLSEDTWTKKLNSAPISKTGPMAYLGDDQILRFGGANSSNSATDGTHIYDLSDNAWTSDLNSIKPSKRQDHGMAETSMMPWYSYVVMYGGRDYGPKSDTWLFGGGDYPVPVELSSFVAIGGQGCIALEWATASELRCHSWEVHRGRQADGEFCRVGELPGHGSTETAHTYRWVDRYVAPDVIYYYKVKQIDLDGSSTWTAVVSASAGAAMPADFVLRQNYPNPFNPATEISYAVPQDVHVSVKIYNVQGGRVATLVDTDQTAGFYTVSWNAEDLSCGVYFCTLRAGAFEKTIKMALVK